MRGNYPTPVLGWIEEYEGGYVNHPDDPGGATNRGVTQGTYDSFRRSRGLAPQSVKRLTDDEHSAIYRTRYWNPIRGDDLPSGIDACTFDAAVNSGVSRGAKWLQRAICDVAGNNAVTVDGKIGLKTLSFSSRVDSVLVIQRMCARRMSFLENLRHWRTFGKGWSRRVASIEARSVKLARGNPMKEARKAEWQAKANGRAATASGLGGTASGSGAVNEHVSELSNLPPSQILIGIAVVAVTVALVFGWRAYKARVRAKAYKEVMG